MGAAGVTVNDIMKPRKEIRTEFRETEQLLLHCGVDGG